MISDSLASISSRVIRTPCRWFRYYSTSRLGVHCRIALWSPRFRGAGRVRSQRRVHGTSVGCAAHGTLWVEQWSGPDGLASGFLAFPFGGAARIPLIVRRHLDLSASGCPAGSACSALPSPMSSEPGQASSPRTPPQRPARPPISTKSLAGCRPATRHGRSGSPPGAAAAPVGARTAGSGARERFNLRPSA